MPAAHPTRYRTLPHGPGAYAAFHTECAALVARATELDHAQQALAHQLAHVRTQLAELRVAMWPTIDGTDIVHGFRRTHPNGPAPIPPVARHARPLVGKHLRNAALAILAHHATPMTLVEVHRELHLNGYAIASRHPVQRLADALAYETRKGRACRVHRGTYQLDRLNPADRRRIRRNQPNPTNAAALERPPGWS